MNTRPKIAYISIDDQIEFNDPQKGRLFIDGAPDVSEKKLEAMEFARGQDNIVTIAVQRRNPANQGEHRFVEDDRQPRFGASGYCVGEYAHAHPPGLAPVQDKDYLVFKTGNSALDCNPALAQASYQEPYPGIKNNRLEDILQSEGVQEVVLTGTQLKRCLLGTAIDLREKGYQVTVLDDAAARQKVDYTKAVKEDPVLHQMLGAVAQSSGMTVDPEQPINQAVIEALKGIGVTITTFGAWKGQQELAGQGRVQRKLGRDV